MKNLPADHKKIPLLSSAEQKEAQIAPSNSGRDYQPPVYRPPLASGSAAPVVPRSRQLYEGKFQEEDVLFPQVQKPSSPSKLRK